MPNIYMDNSQRWLDLSEVDYLGQFVKSWLAFNAWYRNLYTSPHDREIINQFKWNPNTIRSKIVPLISSTSEEAIQFRALIGALHHRLENYHIYSGKGTEKQRISFIQVYLKPNVIQPQNGTKYGINYSIVQNNNPRQLNSTVTKNNGNPLLQLTQPDYDLAGLESYPDFINNLNTTQQGFLRALYQNMNPKLVANLINYGQNQITVGSYQFMCTPEELFAGVCEVIYLMRCTLFHGELAPSREASACYEPAYHIVRKFLLNIS